MRWPVSKRLSIFIDATQKEEILNIEKISDKKYIKT